MEMVATNIKTKLKLFAWNILAERYNSSPYKWTARLEQIKKILAASSADVICLQEVELATADDDFGEFFRLLGYQYTRHSIDKSRTNPIGNLTAWKGMDLVSIEFKSAAIIAKFKTITLANIHLKAGVNSGLDTRVSQLKSILKANPDVIIGDFNDDFILNTKLLDLLAGYNRSVGIKTTYVETGFLNKYWAFDACFFRGRIETITTGLDQPIPDAVNPSDHIPLEVVIGV